MKEKQHMHDEDNECTTMTQFYSIFSFESSRILERKKTRRVYFSETNELMNIWSCGLAIYTNKNSATYLIEIDFSRACVCMAQYVTRSE